MTYLWLRHDKPLLKALLSPFSSLFFYYPKFLTIKFANAGKTSEKTKQLDNTHEKDE
jgi:hypothetical protein